MWKKPQDLSTFTPPAAPGHNPDATESVIGPSVHLEGNFNSSGNIIIGGSLAGGLTTSGDVRVQEGAKVQATVSATHIYVSGEVRGDVRATELLELAPSARLYGNVEAKVLAVAPGAILHGKCTMKSGGIMKDLKDGRGAGPKEPVAVREIKSPRGRDQKDLSFLEPEDANA